VNLCMGVVPTGFAREVTSPGDDGVVGGLRG
jgi:hypothetical protein